MLTIIGTGLVIFAGYYVFKDQNRRMLVAQTVFDPIIKYTGELKRRFLPDETTQEVLIHSNDKFKLIEAKLLVFKTPILAEIPHIIQIPNEDLSYILDYSWNKIIRLYTESSSLTYNLCLIHLIYEYDGKTYRLILDRTRNQNPSILSDFSWTTGSLKFHQEMVDVKLNNEISTKPNLLQTIIQYAGPLGDFYKEISLNQNKRGFLDSECKELLYRKKTDIYQIETVIGTIIEQKFD